MNKILPQGYSCNEFNHLEIKLQIQPNQHIHFSLQ